MTAASLTGHYTQGLTWFHETFVPHLKGVLRDLSGGAWSLDDYVAFAAGSDVDFMTHVVEAVAAREEVALFPGGWYGFLVGCTQRERIRWATEHDAALACLCVPSVRNGQVTSEMREFLESAPACLLNINLFPTLAPAERHEVARGLAPILDRSILSVSFSRGFGLTASQLGVALIHRDHPMLARYEESWRWLTYFHNSIAAEAFERVDLAKLQTVDRARRDWVSRWLSARGLPVVESGSYYVRSFRLKETEIPERLLPLCRDRDERLIRLCFKPPQV